MKYLAKEAKKWMKVQPKLFECNHLAQEGNAKPVFYEGIQGTRVFAWIGLPKGASSKHKVPGIVLVHGGAGTAYARWVNYWTKRGYAAIAMDNCGAMPEPNGNYNGSWPRHAFSGAAGWGAFGNQMTLPPEQQWFTHAVSATVLGHNILRSMPEVDASRIGITGISWGGVLTMICAGVDPRYSAACVVYSCGFLYDNKDWFRRSIGNAPKAAVEWWKKEWDPAHFVPMIQCPVLWFASTNDGSIFYPEYWQKTAALAGDLSERTLLIRLHHTHDRCSEEQPEINAFFDEYLNKGKARIRLTGTQVKDGRISTSWKGEKPLGALLTFTRDTFPDWFKKEWMEIPADVRKDGTIKADLPEHCVAAYLTAIDNDLLRISSDLMFTEKE